MTLVKVFDYLPLCAKSESSNTGEYDEILRLDTYFDLLG
jgi:hypothetical protein